MKHHTTSPILFSSDDTLLASLRICLFGGFAVWVHGAPLRKLRTRQGNRLLALLALAQGREMERTALAGQLWIDSVSDTVALETLRRALTDLRDALGPEAHRIESPTKFTLRLDLSEGAILDVLEFDRAIAQGTATAIDRAIELYQGPLMPDLDAVHDPDGRIRNARQHRHHAFLQTIEHRAGQHQVNHRTADAITDYRHLLAADPTREPAVRSLMELLLREADRTGALNEYLRLRRALSRELGIKPEPATRALYERIQIGNQRNLAASRTSEAAPPSMPSPKTTRLVTLLFAQLSIADRLAESRVRQIIEANEGMLYAVREKTYRAVFSLPVDALAAAGELMSESTARFGVALHTGVASLQEGEYSGPEIDAAAALLAAGHSGQVLLTAVTASVVRNFLSAGYGLRDLGPHRLQKNAPAEHVYQWIQEGQPNNFPPIHSLEPIPSNLPIRLTRFIGREAAMDTIRDLLRANRLLTLTGTGGSGKTRLAQQVAGSALDEYPDGVWMVELAPLIDATFVERAVASALKAKIPADQSVMEALIAHLHDKRLLLLLDNCEHLIDACANLAATLLAACPNISILATSREPLRIFGEQTWRVVSLTLPEIQEAIAPVTAARIVPYESVRLFMDRAALAEPRFELTDGNALLVARICQRVDGIPLAIELAAARMRELPLEQMVERLDDRFRLLTVGDRTALPRQQTLRALIDWSYDLLESKEKTLFTHLSVFVGGWTLAAAETVCAGDNISRDEIAKLLTSLVDKSLVQIDAGGEGIPRFLILETLREYAASKRETSEEASGRRRHRDFFADMVEEVVPKLRGAERELWLHRLEADHDNLRLALKECIAPAMGEGVSDTILLGLRFAGTLSRFWQIRGYYTEGREFLARAFASYQSAVTKDRDPALETPEAKRLVARALGSAGILAAYQGDYAAAQWQYEESLAIWRTIGDKDGMSGQLNSLGIIAYEQGDLVTARSRYEESLRLAREVGDTLPIARVLNNLGCVALRQNDLTTAWVLHEETLSLAREMDNKSQIASALNNLGVILQKQKEYAAAQSHYEESLRLHRVIGDKRNIAIALNSLGSVAIRQKNYALARSHYEESVRLDREVGSKWGSAYGVEGMATVLYGEGDPYRAAVLTAATGVLRQSIRAPLSPEEQAEQEDLIAQLRANIDNDTFEAAWTQGQTMTWEQTVEYALGKDTLSNSA